MIEADIRRLYANERGEPILRDIRFTLNPGEMVALLGASDSGKSAFCRLLAGVWRHDNSLHLDGTIQVDGRDISCLPLTETFGMVSLVVDDFQNQLFCSTVWEDLAFGPAQLCLPPGEICSRIAASIAVGGLDDFKYRNNGTLSGGEMQRTALASYLSINAPYLILDRAAAQIDETNRRIIYRRLADRCRKHGLGVLFVDDRLEEIAGVATRVIVIDKGTLIHDGEIESAPEFARYKAPSSSTHRFQTSRSRENRPIIEVQQVHSRYSESDFGLQDVSLNIYPGEWVTIVGPNGAGKSTLIKHLNGLLLPTSGQILVAGQNTRTSKPHSLSDVIGYVSQIPANQIFADTVQEEVGFNLKIRGRPRAEIESRGSAY